MKWFVLMMLSLHDLNLCAQTAGRACMGLAAFAPGFRDACSGAVHPSAFADAKKISGGMYAEQPFLIPEWKRGALVIAVPSQVGNFGFTANFSGTDHFTDSKLQLAYARMLSDKTDAGISIQYRNRSYKTYGNESALGYAASFTFQV